MKKHTPKSKNTTSGRTSALRKIPQQPRPYNPTPEDREVCARMMENIDFGAMQTRIYKLTPPAQRRLLKAEERAEIERSILDTFECPHCGETEPPFLDLFGLDLSIECDACGYPGDLREFVNTDQ